jgi:hypothetical protein
MFDPLDSLYPTYGIATDRRVLRVRALDDSQLAYAYVLLIDRAILKRGRMFELVEAEASRRDLFCASRQ